MFIRAVEYIPTFVRSVWYYAYISAFLHTQYNAHFALNYLFSFLLACSYREVESGPCQIKNHQFVFSASLPTTEH